LTVFGANPAPDTARGRAMTTHKVGFRRSTAGVGIALITLIHTSASPTAVAIPTAGSVRFVDHGGPVLHTAQVNLLYWGSTWTGSGTSHPTPDQITAAIHTLVAGPYLSGLAQYRDIKPAVLRGSTVITSSDPPTAFTDEQVGDFLDTQLDAGVVPEPDRDQQTLYIVVMPVGAYAGGVVGEHNYYTRHGQRIRFAWTADSASLATATRTISHELVESITDPEGSAVLGVAGTCSQGGWCEIVDSCPDPRILDGIAAAPYWSNQAGACIAPDQASASPVQTRTHRGGHGSRRDSRGGPVTRRSSGPEARRFGRIIECLDPLIPWQVLVEDQTMAVSVHHATRYRGKIKHNVGDATRVSMANDGCDAFQARTAGGCYQVSASCPDPRATAGAGTAGVTLARWSAVSMRARRHQAPASSQPRRA
jgi:hypothetical protein